MTNRRFTTLLLAAILLATPVLADDPQPGWTGSFGAGLSWTSGNTDTKNYNLTLELTNLSESKKNTVKTGVLYLRGEKDGELTVDRTSATVRDEYSFTDRFYGFGTLGYQQDEFKELDRAVDVAGGGGWRVVKSDDLELSFDLAVGWIEEKYQGYSSTSDGTYRLGEAFSWKISDNASLKQSANGLWKWGDSGDAVYHGELLLATKITTHAELQIGVYDDYRAEPPDPEIDKNDVSVVTAVVMKF